MAHAVHPAARVNTRTIKLVTAGITSLVAVRAHADCPTNLSELPATGFLAQTTRALLGGPPHPDRPALTARIGVAGGMLADDTAVIASASASGEVTAQHKGASACASADVVDAYDTSARITASGQVPLFFTGLAVGAAFDHDVTLPLSSRPEFLIAPASRMAVTVSTGFVDLELTDNGNDLRLTVVPFTMELSAQKQDAAARSRERQMTKLAAAMVKFVASDDTGTGELDIVRAEVDWIDVASLPAGAEATGFARISLASFESTRGRSKLLVDGGAVMLAGPVDCEARTCTRGFYRLAYGRGVGPVAIEGRAERTAFMASDDMPAFEDRLGVTGAIASDSGQLSSNMFVARTRAWFSDTAGITAGVRVTATQQLTRGFHAFLDGELARTYYGTGADPGAIATTIAPAARVMVSLGWQATAER